MRVHTLQHVAFEGLGSMESHLLARGHVLTFTGLYRDEPLPAPDDLDWLIVMGGPMSVNDTGRHPWLVDELALISACIDAGKRVLGICLGAQLIAKALGGTVRPNAHREIGWFPVRRVDDAAGSPLAAVFPDNCEVFHWHGETFAILEGATQLMESPWCANQAYVVDGRHFGMQCHVEMTPELIRTWYGQWADEITALAGRVPSVQTPQQMEEGIEDKVRALNAVADRIYDRWLEGLVK